MTVIGLSFLESSYSLGFKNTQFSIAEALIPICHTPKNGLQRKVMLFGVQLNWYHNTSAKNGFELQSFRIKEFNKVLNYIVKISAELGP